MHSLITNSLYHNNLKHLLASTSTRRWQNHQQTLSFGQLSDPVLRNACNENKHLSDPSPELSAGNDITTQHSFAVIFFRSGRKFFSSGVSVRSELSRRTLARGRTAEIVMTPVSRERHIHTGRNWNGLTLTRSAHTAQLSEEPDQDDEVKKRSLK